MLNFLGIGAQKAGTTWLYEMLSHHPEISFPGGKEVHFWDSKDYQDKIVDYIRIFEGEGKVMGEITPAYTMLNKEKISLIKEAFPGLKIVFIMRNPIDRAWSSSLMALKRAELEVEEVSGQWFKDHFNSRGSKGRGDYVSCLKNWRSTFSEDDILVLNYDELKRDPRALLKRTLVHIGLDERWVEMMAEEQLKKKVFLGKGCPLPSELRAELLCIYKPIIEELSTMVNEDVLSWLSD